MFSYFQKGITGTTPTKIIDLPQLIKQIKNNPEKPLLDWIRVLRKQGNDEYNKLKEGLPNITPNCMVRYRALKDEKFQLNFIASSGYIYFDIDDIKDVDSYKEYFIKRYGHLVTMVCKSSSCGGISFLFKLTNTINSNEEFLQIWDTVRTTILKDESIDIKCKDFGRAMYIPYDPDVYVNYENEITIDSTNCLSEKDSMNRKERVKHPISSKKTNNRVDYSFLEKEKKQYSILSIEEVLKKIITKSFVPVDNLIVDFKPIEYAEVFIPKVIKDGTKHTIYTKMIHQLVYLNPTIEQEYIFSYLWFINNTHARPKMEKRELTRLFHMVYTNIKTTGEIHPSVNTKWVHFNPKYKLTGKEKNIVANILKGFFTRYQSINKIVAAKEELTHQGLKVTQKQVAQLSEMSLKTVQTHFTTEPIDMDLVIQRMNDPETKILKEIPTGMGLNNRKPRFVTVTLPVEFIHPDCPQWVLNQGRTNLFL